MGNESWFGIGEELINVGSDPTDAKLGVYVTVSLSKNENNEERFSRELRLSSNLDCVFNYIAGIYYEDESNVFEQNIII